MKFAGAVCIVCLSVLCVLYVSNGDAFDPPAAPPIPEGWQPEQDRHYTGRSIPALPERRKHTRAPRSHYVVPEPNAHVASQLDRWQRNYEVTDEQADRTLAVLSDVRANYRARVRSVRALQPHELPDRWEAMRGLENIEDAKIALGAFLTEEQIFGLDNEIGWELLLSVTPVW